MARFIRIMFACALVLAMASPAFTAEVKVYGTMDFSFGKAFYQGSNHPVTDYATRQRIRTFIDFIVSENLKGVVAFEVGETNWGNTGRNNVAGQGFSIGGDGVSIEVKNAYIDWVIPNTRLRTRMGLQPITLPYAVAGSPVMEHDMAGITLNYAFNDTVSLNTFWAHMLDGDQNDFFSASGKPADDAHAFGLILPIKMNGASITPYGMYMHVGKNAAMFTSLPTGTKAGDDVDYWWAGISINANLWDPLVLKFDGIYGSQDTSGFDTSGFFLAGSAEYKMENFTPGIFAFYASGRDKHGEGAMPIVSATGFRPTSMATDGGFAINSDKVLTDSGIGFWGVGLSLSKLPSFSDRLSHTIRLAYFQGTHDKDASVSGMEMTTKDWAWEVNFDTQIKIYDNLLAMFELGYVGLDFDDAKRSDQEGVFKINLGMRYRF